MAGENPICVPAILYGDAPATREAWAKISKQVWVADSWDSLSDWTEFIPIDYHPEMIVVRTSDLQTEPRDRRTWSVNESYWHFNWILEEYPASYEELVQSPEKHFRFVLSAMSETWFCIGLLGDDFRHLPFLSHFNVTEPTNRIREEVIKPMLRRFIRRLPELLTLEGRVAVAVKNASKLKRVQISGQLGCMIDLAFHAGLLGTEEDFMRFCRTGPDSFAPALLECGDRLGAV